MAFLGQNPFLVKQEIIERVHGWVFMAVAMFGIALELWAEVTGLPRSERRRSRRFYTVVALTGIVLVFLGFWVLAGVGNSLARRCWQPLIVTQMRDAYGQARFIVEHDGWRRDQLAVRHTLTNPETYRAANLEVAQRTIAQIEALLELPVETADLKVRLATLGRYFPPQ